MYPNVVLVIRYGFIVVSVYAAYRLMRLRSQAPYLSS
ncbi:MAG: hypothetical protein ACI9D5_002562 [Candidatus Endobugula sp.]|jgi:hypothetical protein